MQLQSKQLECYTGAGAKTHKTNTLETNCKVQLDLTIKNLCAKQVAQLFLQGVVRQFGLPDNVVHNRDPHFTAEFWTELWHTLGSRAIFSSAYHP